MNNPADKAAFRDDATDPKPGTRRHHVLAIAIDAYQHHKPLRNPVTDCEKLLDLLQRRFEFDLEEDNFKFLKTSDATKREIYKAFYQLSSDEDEKRPGLNASDDLLVILSGHGHYDDKQGMGFFVPYEAGTEKYAVGADFISNADILSWLNAIAAYQITLIADTCFSGSMLQTEVGIGLRSINSLPAPYILASGRVQEVSDGYNMSPFMQRLISALKRHDSEALFLNELGREVLTAHEWKTLQTPWHKQLDTCGIPGVGDPHFRLRKGAGHRSGSVTESTPAKPDLLARLRSGSQAYHRQVRNGRFKALQISDLLLTGNSLGFAETQVKSSIAEGETPGKLPPALQHLWQSPSTQSRHAIVMGDGGMGKTVTLVRLWQQSADPEWPAPIPNPPSPIPNPQSPIPIFISLNEYNTVKPEDERSFLQDSIFHNFLRSRQPSEVERQAFLELVTAPRQPGDSPALLLLLDGLNEVTRDKGWLEKELRDLLERWTAVQVVVTTRYELGNFTLFSQFGKIELLPLSDEEKQVFLEHAAAESGSPMPPNFSKLALPAEPALRSLLGNPMMLTLYAATGERALRHEGDARLNFRPVVSTTGELLWNFNEAQLAKHWEGCLQDPNLADRYDFFLHCLLPYIAWRMEREGQFLIAEGEAHDPRFNLETVVRECFEFFNRKAFFDANPRFRRCLGGQEYSALLFLDKPDWKAEMQRFELVRHWLCGHLHLLSQEGSTYRFIHQNFRDFFAAAHLLNEALMPSPNAHALPESWVQRTIPIYVRRMMGNIEGEHHFDPLRYDKKQPMPGFRADSRLLRLLERCRMPQDLTNPQDLSNLPPQLTEARQYATWNVVKTIADGRGTLAGMNLERLDMRMLYLNRIPLSHHLGAYRYLPARLSGSLLRGKLLFPQGHSNWVKSAAYSLDGSKIVSASGDKTIREWSAQTGECLQTLIGHSDKVRSAAYSPDGSKIVSASDDKTIREWSVQTGECLQTLEGHSSIVNSAAYSPDGSKIVSASDDGTIKEWSVQTGECLQTLEGHSGTVTSAAYSPDSSKIVSASYDKTIREWSVQTGECLQTLEGHSSIVNSAAYSPDGSKIVSASWDKTIREWSAQTGECLQTLEGHSGSVNSAAYSPDGSKIVSASDNSTIREWSVQTGECLQTLGGHSGRVSSAAYSPDGSKIISASWDKTIREWSAQTGECLQTLEGHSGSVNSAAYSPDGNKFVSASGDKTIREWSVQTGECLQTIEGHSGRVSSTAYSPDGSKIVSASDDGTIKEWSVQTGECLQTLEGHSGTVTSAAYSPDSSKIVSASSDQTIREWSAQTGKCLQTLEGHSGKVTSVAYSPDGSKIVSRSLDTTIKEWSAQTGECLSTRKVNWSEVLPGRQQPGGERYLRCNYGKVEELSPAGEVLRSFINVPGLSVWGCDFTHLHKGSELSKEEKELLKMYGAVV